MTQRHNKTEIKQCEGYTKREVDLFNSMNQKQQLFCIGFLNTLSNIKAYRYMKEIMGEDVGNHPKHMGYAMANGKKVSAFIKSVTNRLRKKDLSSALGNLEYKRAALIEIIETIRKDNKEGKRASLTQAINAINLLTKIDGDFAPEKKEISGIDGGPIETHETKEWIIQPVSPKKKDDGETGE